MHFSAVAPPRGERGLKLFCYARVASNVPRRSPSWGAWIETLVDGGKIAKKKVSLPLVGSVD